jgi:transposase
VRQADCELSGIGAVGGVKRDRRRLAGFTKQGNSLLRFPLVEAAQVAVRSDPEWRRKFFHLAVRRGRNIAKVATARRLAVRRV